MNPTAREQFLRELETHLNAAYNFAFWLTRGSEETEDIVQDALARAISRWEQFTPGTQMKSWLFTIVRRTYLNRIRRGKYEVTSAGYPENDDMLADNPKGTEIGRLPENLVRRDLIKALEELTEDQRALVLLADVEDLTLEEVAQVMDIPIGTVKSRLWRTRQLLRRKLIGYQVTQK